MTPDELLDIARLTGLRQHLHGLSAERTREILVAFVAELERRNRDPLVSLARELGAIDPDWMERSCPPGMLRDLVGKARAAITITESTPSGRRRFQGQGELERTGYIEPPPRWVDQQPKPAPTRYEARNPQRHDWTCRHCGRPEEEHARTVVGGEPASCRTEHRHIHAWTQERATTATPNPDYVDADRHTPAPRRRRTDQDRTA